jgi:hypothetical protein
MHFKSFFLLSLSFLSLASGLALPSFTAIDVLSDVLLFVAPAFQNPSEPSSIKASIQGFVSLRTPPVQLLVDAAIAFLKSQGIDLTAKGDEIVRRIADRVQLFAATGLPGKDLTNSYRWV